MNKTATASVAVNSLSQRDTWISIFIIGLALFYFWICFLGECNPDSVF